jgi:hypothetical protein
LANQLAQAQVAISAASLIAAQNPPPGHKVLAGTAVDFAVK